MKKIQILLFISTNFIFINTVKSQYAIAGIKGAIYVDIVPDTLLNPAPHSTNNPLNYFIDINQDGIKDIEIAAFINESPGSTYEYVSFSSIDTSTTSFHFGEIDSSYVVPQSNPCNQSYWETSTILKKFDNADTIQNSTYIFSGYLAYYDQGYCNSGAVGGTEWINSNDHYVGVKYKTANSILYGWVRVVVSDYNAVLIKDFSLGIPMAGIVQFANNEQINIYPNPAQNKITIDATDIAEAKLFDILGNQIISTKENQLDVSTLVNGVYFIQVKTNQGLDTKKIIVQH